MIFPAPTVSVRRHFGLEVPAREAVRKASLESLVQRYGPSPRAFLTVPIVGAFLLDFVNALLINGSLSILG